MLSNRVRHTLEDRGLLRGSRQVLVACSGGPDSQALLHVLHALSAEHGCTLTAASVDHGLRAEAAADVDIARQLAASLGVPFVALKVRVPAGASRQAQARTARYQALLRCAADRQIERIAVGHTLDDQAETVLSRILRGTSIEGLSAIAPQRADGVVRPLIDASRALVHAYVARHALPTAADPSNHDERYLRVRVRKQLLPALSAENPNLSAQLAALADDARDARRSLAREAERAMERARDNAALLLEESPYVRRWALKMWAERETGAALQRTHLVALDRMLCNGGQVGLPGDWIAALNERAELKFSRVVKRGRGARRPTDGTD